MLGEVCNFLGCYEMKHLAHSRPTQMPTVLASPTQQCWRPRLWVPIPIHPYKHSREAVWPATLRFSHKGTGFPWIGNILFWLEGGGRGAGRTQPPTFLAFLAAVLSSCLAVTGGTGPAEPNSSLGALGLGGNRGSLLFSILHSIPLYKKLKSSARSWGVCVGVSEDSC